jgi:hypothetical protein
MSSALPRTFDTAPVEATPGKRVPRKRTGQNRQARVRAELFKIPVNVPPEVHAYRAENVTNARELPGRLRDTMIAYILAADIAGPRIASYEQIAAYSESAGLRQRFKFEPVSIRQAERHTADLHKLGVLETELVRESRRSKATGKYESRRLIEFEVNASALAEYAGAARAENTREREAKAARRAAAKAGYNERQKARRAAVTVVEFDAEPMQGNNSCGHENGGTAGEHGGNSGGSIVPAFPFGIDRFATSSGRAGARDDGATAENIQSQTHGGTGPGDDSPADGVAVDAAWIGDGDNARDNRAWLAQTLDVSLGSIGAPLWRWLDDTERRISAPRYTCECRCKGDADCPHGDAPCECICPTSGNAEKCECECEHDRAYSAYMDAVRQAARDSRGKPKAVGYFRTILPQQIDALRAERDAEAQRRAEIEEAERQRQEEADRARAERAAAEAECAELLPRYVALWWDREPQEAHEIAMPYVRSRRNPVERLAWMRGQIAQTEASVERRGEQEAHALFLKRYAEWAADQSG